jgi:hypothetical protein
MTPVYVLTRINRDDHTSVRAVFTGRPSKQQLLNAGVWDEAIPYLLNRGLTVSWELTKIIPKVGAGGEIPPVVAREDDKLPF